MAFKLEPKYNIDNTPIYSKDMEGNILGLANKNGSIVINKNIPINEIEKSKTIEHEKIHLDQMRRGDLDYTDTDVFWKGKKYPRSKMREGDKNLPWEQEAYKKQ